MPRTSRALDMVLALEKNLMIITVTQMGAIHIREHATAGSGTRARMTDNVEALLLADLADSESTWRSDSGSCSQRLT